MKSERGEQFSAYWISTDERLELGMVAPSDEHAAGSGEAGLVPSLGQG